MKILSIEERNQRLNALRSEFRDLIEFHEKSFKDIDDKGRYWLTITLPAFLALFGYLINEPDSVSAPLLSAGCALATCLAITTFFFSSVLISERVESGILAPMNKDIDGLSGVVDDDKQWNDLPQHQAKELLRAIKVNEAANSRKSTKLSKAEWSLFRSAPAATVLAAGLTFVYTASGPLTGSATAGLSTRVISTSAAAGLGIGVGTIVAAAAIAIRHRCIASK